MHHAASQRDPLAAFFATPRVVDLPCPGMPSYPTASCDVSLLSGKPCTFPDAAGLPQRRAHLFDWVAATRRVCMGCFHALCFLVVCEEVRRSKKASGVLPCASA